MASPSGSEAKICVRCKADVTNAPRMKDQQGRYFCEACVKALKSKPAGGSPGPARAATPAGGSNLMDRLVADAAAEVGKGCPECGAPVRANTVVCTNCGLNLSTGKRLVTRVKKSSDAAQGGKSKKKG